MGLPSMRPTGWFQVAWSADLEVGDVKPLHYFGIELVAFRDLTGTVRILDAHCQHMGADLSHGGCVVEGGIQCPCHGWVWSGDDGHNVRIPYEPQADDARRVGSWPIAEFNECIYVWHDGSPVEICWHGLGLSFSCEDNGDGMQIISICPTPVDDFTSDVFATYWVSEDLDYDVRLAAAKQMLSDDIAIWAHLEYLDRPAL